MTARVGGTGAEVEAYLVGVAALLDAFGATLQLTNQNELELLEDPEGRLTFELMGELPGEPGAPPATLVAWERFVPVGPDAYERSEYVYEVLDRERDYRRGFHLHSPDWFGRNYLVVVHEHFEQPVGHEPCPHYEGLPIHDGYAGVAKLMEVWAGPAPDRATLRCLD
jgi:hypothetical protein